MTRKLRKETAGCCKQGHLLYGKAGVHQADHLISADTVIPD